MAGKAVSLSAQNLYAHESSSFRCRPSGKPRLRQLDRHLYNFYEPMILLSMLVHNRLACEPKSGSELARQGEYKAWQKYIDSLCWLCDHKLGGKSVNSIAVQDESPGPLYCLAINQTYAAEAKSHLEDILSELVKLQDLSSSEQQRIEEEIVTRCIDFSSDTVKNYGRLLCQSIENVMKCPKWSPQIDDDLRENLDSMEQLQFQHHKLCRFASEFPIPSLVSLDDFCRKSRDPTRRSEWSKIRHCIGRLGSWSKAAKIVVRAAKKHPGIVKNFKVKYVESGPPLLPPTADHKTTLQEVIRRLFPRRERECLKLVWEKLQTVTNFVPEFHEKYNYRSATPHPHCEVVLAEYIHMNEFKFFGNKRYIGCSKPSCYCCQLYLEFHPGEFVQRPYHGNLFKKWVLPSSVVDGSGKIKWHAKRILERMAERARNDAFAQMKSKLPCGPRMPDSTTGLSPLPDLNILGINIDRLRLDRPVDFGDNGETNDVGNEELSDSED